MRLQQLVSLASIVTIAQAWPWPPSFGGDSLKAVEGIDGLFRRQNNGGSNTPTNTASGATNTAQSGQGTSTGQNSASITGSARITGTRASASGGNATATEYDPRDPAGGVSMITPNQFMGPQYYKVGDWIHFAWNYTSLQASPTAINVVATCKDNQATYTLATNQSFAETGEIYWDTGSYQKTATQQLLTNQYTLIIYDADGPVTPTVKPGYLGAYSGFIFGMYTPQPYQPWSDYSCPTCSAGSTLEKMTLTFLFGMASITVLTFTWFATSIHLL